MQNRGNEEYRMTHPESQLNGFLRGNLYISVSDIATISCPQTRLRCILHYVEDSYFGKAQNKVVGVVHRYDPSLPKEKQYLKPKDVPSSDVLLTIEGDWKERLYYSIPSSAAQKAYHGLEPTKTKQVLLDLAPLFPVPKLVPPPEQQLPNESRKLWADVSNAINARQYNDATRIKQDIEQQQRDRAAERERERKAFKPRFFTQVTDPSGRPELTDEGRRALQNMQTLQFHLDPRLDDSVVVS